MQTQNSAMRFFFLVVASVIALGIWLTGYQSVHWVLYLPAVFFLFAAVTGICPGIIISNSLFGGKSDSSAKKRKR